MSLDVPARFNVLQSAVETLQCQHRELAEDVKRHNQKPVATMCHAPTQVSPPPAPPLRVTASAQVSSPMLAVLRTLVSAGTQMTPQHQYATNGLHASEPAPEMKTTKRRNLHDNRGPAQICHGTSMSPPGTYRTAAPCREQLGLHSVGSMQGPNKKARSGSTRMPADKARATKQVLGDATNTQKRQRKPQENVCIRGKESGLLGVVVPVCTRSKQKRSEQVWRASGAVSSMERRPKHPKGPCCCV